MKVVLASDRTGLLHFLGGAAMTVDRAGTDEELQDLLVGYEYDAVILEGRSRSRVQGDVRRIRTRAHDVPILVLGADDTQTRVACLHGGADDAMPTATAPDEVIARLAALVRRCNGHARATLAVGNLAVDLHAKVVTVDGFPLGLTAKEFKLLRLFALRADTVLDKQQVLNALYTSEDEPDDRIVGVYLCTLRRKLREAGADALITTIRGLGYVMRTGGHEISSSNAFVGARTPAHRGRADADFLRVVRG